MWDPWQVYYAEACETPSWKVVLRKEVRGRRISGALDVVEPEGLFAMGRDADHEGLPIDEDVLEKNHGQLPTSHNIRRQEVFASIVDDWEFVARDVGESGSLSEEGL
jgi:hypothetical protein